MTTMHRGLPVSHLTAFVGREAESGSLRTLVASRRLVTVTGQAGVGKSRTAAHVADTLRRSLSGSIVLVPMAGRRAHELGSSNHWKAAHVPTPPRGTVAVARFMLLAV